MKLLILTIFFFISFAAFSQAPVYMKVKQVSTTPPNQRPVVLAGVDQVITLPIDAVYFSGSATDANGILSYHWAQSTGPNFAVIIDSTSATTGVINMIAGTYSFVLTATDSLGLQGSDSLTVVVNAAINIPPVADAGINQTITLPTNSVILTGSGTDTDGTIVSYFWEYVSGPLGSIIVSPNSASTAVTSLTAGEYYFKLTVTDDRGGTGTKTVKILVNASPPINVLPIANAGVNQVIIQQ